MFVFGLMTQVTSVSHDQLLMIGKELIIVNWAECSRLVFLFIRTFSGRRYNLNVFLRVGSENVFCRFVQCLKSALFTFAVASQVNQVQK